MRILPFMKCKNGVQFAGTGFDTSGGGGGGGGGVPTDYLVRERIHFTDTEKIVNERWYNFTCVKEGYKPIAMVGFSIYDSKINNISQSCACIGYWLDDATSVCRLGVRNFTGTVVTPTTASYVDILYAKEV